ncbi:MAG: hypothetical protein C4301_01465 [Thermus sp.]|uniref:O-antigen ligase family protein n=1 Tax=Thermus sp. TaxID=275 RepID=UPI003324963F
MDHRFFYWLFWTSALLYPFVLWPGRFGAAWVNPEEVWIFPKVVFLLLVGVLGMVEGRRALTTPFGLLMALYLGLVLLSSFRPLLTDDPTYTLLGGEGRMDGLLYQIGLVLFALLAFRVFQKEPRGFRAFSYVLLGSTAFQSLLLLLQRLGLEPIGPLLRGLPYEAPVGTVGNPGMAAGLLLPGLLLGLGLWLERSAPRRGHLKDRFSFLFFPLTALMALGLGVTLNRAGLLGLTVALGLWLLRQRSLHLALTGALSVLLALSAPTLIPDRQGFSKEFSNPTTGFTRLLIWKLAWEGIRSTPGQPLLGGGPDAFRVALLTRIPFERLLEEYRLEYGWPKGAKAKEIKPLWTSQDPLRSRAWLVLFGNWRDERTGKQAKILRVYLDKAHNLFLDRWLSYGLFAALVWVYLYLGGALKAWGDTPLRQALATGLIGLFVYYLFWFPVPQVEPLHAALIGAAFGLSRRVELPGSPGPV